MKTVVINISDRDWEHMVRHITHRGLGRPTVAVEGIVEIDPGGDDRPMSVEAINQWLEDNNEDFYDEEEER